MSNQKLSGWPTHTNESFSLPCCDVRVSLRVPFQEATHLHERTCKECGRVWTFATERRRQDKGDGWLTGTSIKLGRPTLPAVGEVLSNRDEDGWHHTDPPEMLRLKERIKAGNL